MLTAKELPQQQLSGTEVLVPCVLFSMHMMISKRAEKRSKVSHLSGAVDISDCRIFSHESLYFSDGIGSHLSASQAEA